MWIYILTYYTILSLLSVVQDTFTPYEETIPGSAIDLQMVPVKGGTFMMGAAETEPGFDPDEAPRHEVHVDDFWIGRYEITWEQYEAFAYRTDKNEEYTFESLGIDGVSAATSPYVDMSNGMGKSGYPAIGMTQYAAVMFCKWLSARTGQFYRLPTEAEWEYACRAGAESAWSFGDDAAGLGEYAVYEDNSNYVYARSGSKQANAWNIYDMSGNVAEWTMDQYSPDYYQHSPEANPWNKPESLYPRVVRGGSYKDEAADCRCTARAHSRSSWKRLDPQIPKSRWWHTNAFFVGFRVVRPRVQPGPEEIKDFWLEPVEDYGQ